MVEEGEASLLKITKLIGLGETLGGGGSLRRGIAWIGDRPNFCQAAEPSSASDLFLTRSILRFLQTAFTFCSTCWDLF